MNIQHELMEVYSLFLLHSTCLMEEVHQHGLTTTHTTIQVEATGGSTELFGLISLSGSLGLATKQLK